MLKRLLFLFQLLWFQFWLTDTICNVIIWRHVRLCMTSYSEKKLSPLQLYIIKRKFKILSWILHLFQCVLATHEIYIFHHSWNIYFSLHMMKKCHIYSKNLNILYILHTEHCCLFQYEWVFFLHCSLFTTMHLFLSL